MPPFVTSLGPGNGFSGPLKDENVLDLGGVLESGINNSLCGDSLSAPSAFVRGDQNARLAILDAVPERLRREAGEDNRMNGTDTRAGKESGNGVPGHWHVNRDGVALLNSHTLEDIGNAANFAEKLSVGDFATLIRLIGLVDDRGLSGKKHR